MNKFKLCDYSIAVVRDGQSEYHKDQRLIEIESDRVLVVYRHDVYTYYYSVPVSKINLVGNELLEFFYKDNYDYSDEDLIEFKCKYQEFFKI